MNSTKIIAPVAVAIVAILAIAGAAYAYTATYTDTVAEKPVAEEYAVITNNGGPAATFVYGEINAKAVWDTDTVKKDGAFKTTYSNGKFVNSEGTTITTVTVSIGAVKLVDQAGDGITGASLKLSGSLEANDPAVTDGKTSAVTGDPAFTFTDAGAGVYNVSITFTLVTITGTYTAAPDYVIPGYTVKVIYNSVTA